MSSLFYNPKIFDLAKENERLNDTDIVKNNPLLNVQDQLNSQIYKFVKLSNPSLVNKKKELDGIYHSFHRVNF